MPQPLASIVVPVFNNLAFVRALHQSVVTSTPAGAYELVFVDNKSNETGMDAWYESVKNERTKVIKNPANLGFGRANNIGLKNSTADFVVLLNSDMLVTPGWLDALVACCQAGPAYAAVQAKILLVDDNPKEQWKTQTCGAQFNQDGLPVYHLSGYPREAPEVNTRLELQAFMGTGVLLRRAVIERVGFFDESFDLVFMEDTDLSLRISQAGFKIFYEPAALLYHFHSASMPHLSQEEYDRSRACNLKLFQRKWPKEKIFSILKNQKLL
jgi:GT2 family glycosyltransferase